MVSLYGLWRQKSPKVSSVEKWWRMGQDGGAVEPTQVDARRGRFVFCASVERSRWYWWVGRGGKRAHPNRYPVLNDRILYVVGKEAVKRSDAWLERSRTRPGGFKEPRNKNEISSEKGSGRMVAVGRTIEERAHTYRCSVRKAHHRGKPNNYNSEDGLSLIHI